MQNDGRKNNRRQNNGHSIKFISATIVAAAFIGGCQDSVPSPLAAARNDLSMGKYTEADAAAETYLAQDSESPHAAEAYYLKGRALEALPATSQQDANEHLQQARYAYVNALKVGPLDRNLEGLIRASIANVAYWQEDYQTAAEQGTTAYGMLTDANTRAWCLYRAGLSQQRLGQFESADRTLGMVVKYYPGTQPAMRAQSRIGARAFNVQLLFSEPQLATNAAMKLTKMGYAINRIPAADGRSNILIGPLSTYAQASSIKAQVASEYPMAQIIP